MATVDHAHKREPDVAVIEALYKGIISGINATTPTLPDHAFTPDEMMRALSTAAYDVLQQLAEVYSPDGVDLTSEFMATVAAQLTELAEKYEGDSLVPPDEP